MTREEALEWFKDRKKMNLDDKCQQAEDMAIKALEQEPCREADDYENEIEDLHNRLDIAEYDKERLREEVTNLEEKIKALEKEPEHLVNESGDLVKDLVKDTISRQAVLSKIKEVCFSEEWLQFRVDNGSNGQRDFLINYIKQLPPVKPQEPKTGHWIRMKAYEKWGCSECSTVFRFTFKEHNYCPNCGAKMVKPQESEG